MANPKDTAVIVALPEEVDVVNADLVYDRLTNAMTPGVTLVIADLRLTTFCDSMGARVMFKAREHATESGVRIEFVIPPGAITRVLEIMGLDQVLKPHRTIAAALDGANYKSGQLAD